MLCHEYKIAFIMSPELFWSKVNRCKRQVCVKNEAALDKSGKLPGRKDEIHEKQKENI